jgi:predicted phage-related endonuclease
MLVCGWERCWLAVLHGRSFRTYLIERDDDDIAVLRDAADDFWTRHVLTGDPPGIDGSSATSAALRDAFRGEKDRTLFEPALGSKVAMLREAKATAKQWDATVDLLENELKAAMGDAEFLDCGEGTVAQWSRFDSRRIDSDLLKSRFPDAFELCRKASPSSRFTLKTPKKEKD